MIDHVVARQNGGGDVVSNLALSRVFCNRHKGPNVAGFDPQTGLSRLFHPRQDVWNQYFRFDQSLAVGLTPIGRVTIDVLAMNHPEQLRVRRTLLNES